MKIFKRITAAMLALVLCLSFAACSSADKTWAAKNSKCPDDETMAIGIYIYYMYLAFDRAAEQVPSNSEVLSATIDGKSAEEWIKDKAMNYLQSYYWIEEKIEEQDLSLTAEELSNAKSTTSSFWSSYGSSLENMGISQTSFDKAYSQYNIKYKKIFDTYYGEGGEMEVDKDELKEEFCANQYDYSYMYASITTTDESSNTSYMTDEEMAPLKAQFETYKKKVDSGYETLSEAADEYALSANLSESQYQENTTDLKYQYYPTDFVENLQDMKSGETRIFVSDGQLVLLQKNNIEDAFEADYAVASKKLQMLLDLKSDDFKDYVSEHASEVEADIELNNAGIDSVTVKSVITDSTKNGTLSEASETSEESSEVSE